jgi:hypothetical protein
MGSDAPAATGSSASHNVNGNIDANPVAGIASARRPGHADSGTDGLVVSGKR